MGLTACLWFDGEAEEAAGFYTRGLRGGRIGEVMRYDAATSRASGNPEGTVMTVEFEVEGQKFLALNGGPQFRFNESISFIVERDTQEEIDEVWEALTADGGEESQCGWLRDRFGMSWQVVPTQLPSLMRNPAATQALMSMRKIDIAALERAGAGAPA